MRWTNRFFRYVKFGYIITYLLGYLREYFSTLRRHVSHFNWFNWPDVQLYTRIELVLQFTKEVLFFLSQWHWNVMKWLHSPLVVIVPCGSDNHIANNINRNDVECQLIVAHDAANCSASDFHYDASDAVYIVDPTRKWFGQWTCHNWRTYNAYWQFDVIISNNLFGNWFCKCVRVRMFSLEREEKRSVTMFNWIDQKNEFTCSSAAINATSSSGNTFAHLMNVSLSIETRDG